MALSVAAEWQSAGGFAALCKAAGMTPRATPLLRYRVPELNGNEGVWVRIRIQDADGQPVRWMLSLLPARRWDPKFQEPKVSVLNEPAWTWALRHGTPPPDDPPRMACLPSATGGSPPCVGGCAHVLSTANPGRPRVLGIRGRGPLPGPVDGRPGTRYRGSVSVAPACGRIKTRRQEESEMVAWPWTARWRSRQAASANLTHGTWLVVSVAVGAVAVGSLAAPRSPVRQWAARWVAPSGIPAGTVANPSQVLQGSCQPAVFGGTTGTAILTFPQAEPIQGVSVGECGDPHKEPVTVQGLPATGGTWVSLATSTIPSDGAILMTWSPVAALTALRITVTQSIPDAQIAHVRVQWTSFLP